MARLTSEQLAVFVAESCDRQGVPVKVTDVRVLADVATLLRGERRGLKLEGHGNLTADGEAIEGAEELGETGS